MNPSARSALPLLLALLPACGALPFDSGAGPGSPAAVDLRIDPLLLALPPGEVSSREDDRPSEPASGEPDFYLEASSLQVVSVRPDEDPGEPYDGLEFEADLRTGQGYGISGGVLVDGVGLGLLYLSTGHTERESETDARFHAAFVEARLHGEEDLGWARGTLDLGLGVGAGGVDFEDFYGDSGGTALEARLMLGIQAHHVGLELGGGGFSWGVPGETIGVGTYLSAGLTIWF